jgi:RNA polymerase sigma factor (sigma-70 family)
VESASEREFGQLMARVREGCPEATRELVERYGSALRRLVRRRLHPGLRPVYDSLDFFQDVWASFFQVAPVRTFRCSDDLVAYLAEIAFHKVTDTYRQRLGTEKRNGGRVETLPLPTEEDRNNELPARQPTPSQVAVANECWEDMLRGLPPQHQRMLELLREGYTHEEIAQNLGIYTKVIQRLLQKLEKKGSLR